MGLFQKLEGAAAILSISGVFKQVDLYTWNDGLFASTAGGFVRLMSDGSTSKAKVQLKHLSLDHVVNQDAMGKLTLKQEGVKPLPSSTLLRLTSSE